MPDSGTLANIAAIIAGFGVAMLFFRIQRELQMIDRNDRIWIPYADWLLISATLVSLTLVILPLLALPSSSALKLKIPTAACAATSIMVTGYIVGILSHYRLILGKNRSGPRKNPEPAEKFIVWSAAALAIIVFIILLLFR